ncbi:MAG: hypothetical protein ACO1N3_01120 [Gammaproteobacteria bacterium]
MTDSDLELSLQYNAKTVLQQQKLKAELDAATEKKIKILQDKMEKSSLPQSTLKLRPTNQGTQEQQRLIHREAILQLSRNLRNTNLPNPYALKFQIKGPIFDEELSKKLLTAIKNMQQQRLLTKKRYFEHQAADHNFEEQHKLKKHSFAM